MMTGYGSYGGRVWPDRLPESVLGGCGTARAGLAARVLGAVDHEIALRMQRRLVLDPQKDASETTEAEPDMRRVTDRYH